MPVDITDIVEQIRAWHSKRCFAMEARKRADLALGAALRTWLGWRPDLPADESRRIKLLAQDLIGCGEKLAKGKAHELATSPQWGEFGTIITASIVGRAPFDAVEAEASKALVNLAQLLPVWGSFARDIRGFGPGSLAVIVGESGDLAAYPTHSKLWKRMGLAPFLKDGVALSGMQWRLRGGLSKDDWAAFGYSPVRRSRMFSIGDTLIKQNRGDYRAIYDFRKAYERAMAEAAGLTVAPAAKIPKKRAAEFVSDGAVHARAQRYMEKRLLRDLWRAWRRAGESVLEGARRYLPSAVLAPPLASVDPDGDRFEAGLPMLCSGMDAECTA